MGAAFFTAAFLAAGRVGFFAAGLGDGLRATGFLAGLAVLAALREAGFSGRDFACALGFDLRVGFAGFLAMVILDGCNNGVYGCN